MSNRTKALLLLELLRAAFLGCLAYVAWSLVLGNWTHAIGIAGPASAAAIGYFGGVRKLRRK
jgi:hypothetical protein